MSDRDGADLWRAAGLVDGGHRLLWASGADAVSFLHDLLSQDIEGLSPGRAANSLLLAPNGRLRAILAVARIGDSIVMISAQSDHLMADLTRFRIRVDVDLELDDRPVSMVWGPTAEQALGSSGWPSGPDVSVDSPRWALRDPVVGDRWFAIGAPDDLGVAAVDRGIADVRRIEVGEPQFGVDVDTSTIPNEAFDLTTLVDFRKGCYLGQELVERIDARGRRVKRLTGIVFEDGPVPPPGAALHAGSLEVGVVTSSAFSWSVGSPIALGMIRAEAGEGDAVMASWESHHATGTVTAPPLLTDS